jgi:aldehyde:ferredoxin oxidoreductase
MLLEVLMYGYAGKILEVDLTTGSISTSELDEKDCREFLGGSGLAAKIYLDRFPGPDVDPLGPENLLIFLTGPWTGTRVPGGNRFAVAARSPLTGSWGEASCGGYWGPELKAAGWDGIIFTGASEKPVYLFINGDDAELRDASDLWGKDTYETSDALKEKAKEETGKKARVAAIGPAGETCSPLGAIVHDSAHIAGRTGMGAVMGSKKLKAISVVGIGKKVEIADPEKLKVWRQQAMDNYAESLVVESLRAFGTNANLEVGSMLGDVPFKNWQVGENDEVVEAINGPTYTDDILVKGHACWACPIGCKRVVKVDEGPFAMEQGAGPEYETICMLGTNLLNDNLQSIAKANEICNRLGIDTISLGEAIALVTEAQEKGLLTPADCDGIAITWGDAEAMVKLCELAGKNEGFGKRLGEGTKALAESLGPDAADMAVQVRGLELPAHDPRGFHGFSLAYATSVRGACHCASMNLYLEQGSAPALPDLDLEGPFDEQSSIGKAYLTARAQELGQIFNSAVVCLLAAVSWQEEMLVTAINSVTGFGYDLDSFMEVGERIWFIKRGLQFLFGSTGAEDICPPRLMQPVKEGPHEGSIPEFDMMLREFYEYRELDAEGRPTRAKLEKLDLAGLADKLGV